MNEKMLILERTIDNEMQAVREIYRRIGTPVLTDATDENGLIVLAYLLQSTFPIQIEKFLSFVRTLA